MNIINIMRKYVGSLIFFPLFIFWTFLITISGLFASFFYDDINFFVNAWGKKGLILLRVLVGIKVEFKGTIPTHGIVASQHQSALEVIALSAVLTFPIFVLKKSLIKVPIFGVLLKETGMIPVDRQNLNLGWMKIAEKQIVQNKKTLIIFPEGTRTKFNEIIPYKKGVFRLSQKINQKIYPVALNTGLYWGRKMTFKNPGIATVAFGDPIDADENGLREAFENLHKKYDMHIKR
jgi:1-acyl-sn-glycerol-3-phosphate acyltransferase